MYFIANVLKSPQKYDARQKRLESETPRSLAGSEVGPLGKKMGKRAMVVVVAAV
jgi:hypothetical protein